MRQREMEDAIFRESVRRLEREPKSNTRGKGKLPIPRFIVERRAAGSIPWQPYTAFFSEKKAKQNLPKNDEHYEYRLNNGSHTA